MEWAITSEMLVGFIGVFGTLSGTLIASGLEVYKDARARKHEGKRSRDERRDQFLELISTYRTDIMMALAAWMIVKSEADIESMGVENSPFNRDSYYRLSSLGRVWFPRTKEIFNSFDSEMANVQKDLEANLSAQADAQGAISFLRGKLNHTQALVENCCNDIRDAVS